MCALEQKKIIIIIDRDRNPNQSTTTINQFIMKLFLSFVIVFFAFFCCCCCFRFISKIRWCHIVLWYSVWEETLNCVSVCSLWNELTVTTKRNCAVFVPNISSIVFFLLEIMWRKYCHIFTETNEVCEYAKQKPLIEWTHNVI